MIGTNGEFHRAFTCPAILLRPHNVFRRKSKFLQQIFQWSRCTKTVHPDHFALGADVAIPAEGAGHFDRNASGKRWWAEHSRDRRRLVRRRDPRQGKLTRRALMPSFFSYSLAATQCCNSVPVAMQDDFGLASFSVEKNIAAFGDSGCGSIFVRSSVGMAWRLNTRVAGPC